MTECAIQGCCPCSGCQWVALFNQRYQFDFCSISFYQLNSIIPQLKTLNDIRNVYIAKTMCRRSILNFCSVSTLTHGFQHRLPTHNSPWMPHSTPLMWNNNRHGASSSCPMLSCNADPIRKGIVGLRHTLYTCKQGERTTLSFQKKKEADLLWGMRLIEVW